ncbi:MAG: SRPBCC family protein [Hyphomonas sp.]|jgi:uncharacterized protein YndB with AHSA1/START domain|nr:SRPBCC family protein [Hyphomonas sp.]
MMIDHAASSEVRWPPPFSPENADLFSFDEIVIEASAGKIWKHLTDAVRWPEWYPNARNVRFLDAGSTLSRHSRFAWTAGGLDVECAVAEFDPDRRLTWLGALPGETPIFCHPWLLLPHAQGTRVVTAEVAVGDLPRRIREHDENALKRGNAMWLAVLKWISETP